MLGDLDLIIKQYPDDMNVIRVYAIGDVHVGSAEFDERAIKKKIEIIQNDPCGVVALCGDLGDFGLKNSKTNVYLETMPPRRQIEYIYELFLPIKDKIISLVPGNHEERITREVGTCPMYDLSVRWGISDVYRENVAITKLSFGKLPGYSNRQITFVGITSHGSSRAKHKKFVAGFDGIDWSISGHTHSPEYSPAGRIKIDSHKGTARHVPFKEIVVDANLEPGGYGLKKEYTIAAPPELQYMELSAVRETTGGVRHTRRVMDYHAMQI